jgi:hypothetical protein
LSPTGERTGQDVYAVFALEKVRHVELGMSPAPVVPGVQQIVVMSGPFRSKLSEELQQRTVLAGNHRLKGLDGEQPVFRWLEAQPGDHPTVPLA